MSVSLDRAFGTLLGTAVGDALGMPVEGLSHQNVRTYYKGIKEYRDDDQRGDLEAGQWTDDTQMTFAVVRALAQASGPAEWPRAVAEQYRALPREGRGRRRWGSTTTAAIERLTDGSPPEEAARADRPTDGAAMRAAPLGLWWAATGADREEAFGTVRSILAVTHRHPAALAAGWGQVVAVRYMLETTVDAFDRSAFWDALIDATTTAEARLEGDDRVSARLRALTDQLDAFPLDLRDACGNVGVRADEAWPFACAMVARRPHLLENTLLSGINVGGDADTTGAMMGALLGGLHGWNAFPAEWREGLEATEELQGQARALWEALEER
ncbi:MAG: ADP-ribosylglycohydrolase family protein [Salinibacter sp.]